MGERVPAITSLDKLLAEAISGGKVRVAVAAADDEAALSALHEAHRVGLAEALLFGPEEDIRATWNGLGVPLPAEMVIRDCATEAEAVKAAVQAVREGAADLLLKGKTKTATLLKAVLDAEAGLRTGRLLSDVFVCEDPRRKGNKLLMITDGGVTIAPDINQKVEIILNAVEVAHALGIPRPCVALLSAVETVVPALPSTVDAAIITKMWERGQIKGCVVDGPLALDNAVSEEAARTKGISSEVAGHADILVCPGIEAANMLAKSTTYFAGFRLAHVIVGAKAPVLIPSRADSADAKLMSVALGAIVQRRKGA
ncbi:MAG: bifunctional enoyl-CoA hydratase/phosphate acetyltransferase [candidate division KSB1 bacterium]|nr:bifunctional enoyl-CoA hydratase/phosphate acetyltransferase [candidate division KSB1 bacterium]MDZ7386161.1 bifunctional enoyl-CoA hydratase/phosphate acetyltransferase [candidate division KSB1 bacterium]MDZ7392780.1 bifunctional enoyl-CoA hydratase/phosphate acetyltransferase [candidate division KSB1 bacterium]